MHLTLVESCRDLPVREGHKELEGVGTGFGSGRGKGRRGAIASERMFSVKS